MEAALAQLSLQNAPEPYSHSIVAGGLEEMS